MSKFEILSWFGVLFQLQFHIFLFKLLSLVLSTTIWTIWCFSKIYFSWDLAFHLLHAIDTSWFSFQKWMYLFYCDFYVLWWTSWTSKTKKTSRIRTIYVKFCWAPIVDASCVHVSSLCALRYVVEQPAASSCTPFASSPRDCL